MPYFPPAGGGVLLPNSIDNALLADMIAARIKGRALGAGLGDPTDLTGSQIAAILNADPAPGTLPLLATLVAANSPQLDFTAFDNTKFGKYIADLSGFKTSSDNAVMWVRCSANGGASYDAAANYGYQFIYSNVGTVAGQGVWGVNQINITVGIGSTFTHCNARIEFMPDLVNALLAVEYKASHLASGGAFYTVSGNGAYTAALPNAIRIMPSAGNWVIGTARIYGVPK